LTSESIRCRRWRHRWPTLSVEKRVLDLLILFRLKIQRKLLNGIADIVFIWLMRPNLPRLTIDKVLIGTYCYQFFFVPKCSH
jgi:hypothetical protein